MLARFVEQLRFSPRYADGPARSPYMETHYRIRFFLTLRQRCQTRTLDHGPDPGFSLAISTCSFQFHDFAMLLAAATWRSRHSFPESGLETAATTMVKE